MARKSRKNNDNGTIIAAPGADLLPTAIYARLSVENSGKDDNGAAIENQIEVCREYIKSSPDLELARIYQDNGWTGTVMRRPAFDEMMKAVKSGEIRAIVVRDLSRFARDYIETGTYLERIFPRLDVRFISVKEQFDSIKTDGTNESLMIPLQSLINDLYSKDISRKVETALHLQMEAGEFKWRRIPYGYRWNEDHTNIVPDEVTGPVVRQIFQWKAEGVSNKQIVKRLDEMKAPKYNPEEEVSEKPWATSTLHDIYINPAYIGRRAYGRRHSAIYKGIRLERKPEDEWYVTENAHEALVTEEVFQEVKAKIQRESEKKRMSMEETKEGRGKLVDLFGKKAICADCGYRMYFKRHRECCKDRHWVGDYYCSSSQTRRQLGCNAHGIRQKYLNEKVFEAIKMQVATALDYEERIEKLKDSKTATGIREQMGTEIKSVSLKIKAIDNRRRRLYEDYVAGILDDSEYAYAKSSYESEYEMLNSRMEALTAKKLEYVETISGKNKWIRLMKSVRRSRKLTKELADAVVENVKVFEGGSIEVVFKYQDVFELTKAYLSEIREKEQEDG